MTFSSDALVQSITFKAQDDASPVFKRLGEAAESLTAKFSTASTKVQTSLDTMKTGVTSAATDITASLDALGANKGLSKLSLEMMDTAGDFRSSTRRITSELTAIKNELKGLSSTKITIGSQMQEQARLMSEAARSMEVSAGKMRSAERSSSGGGGRYGGGYGRGPGTPFHSSNFAGRVALGTAGSMAVYAGLGGIGEVAGGGSYRAYTEQATLIAGQTGPQGQAIAYGVNPRTGRPNPVGSISAGLAGQYLRTAPQYGLRPTEAMSGYYHIASSVTDPRQAAALNQASMVTAAAGNVPLTQTADFLVQLNNSYKSQMRGPRGTMRVANAANEAVKAGNMTWAQLPQMMGRSIGMASDIGITPEQLLAMTSMLSTRRNPGEVSPLLTNFTRSLQAPRPMQMRTASALGLDWHKVQADLKNHDLMGAMSLINQAVSQGPVTADDIERNTHGLVTGKAAVTMAANLGTTRQRERSLFGGQSQAMQTFDALFAGTHGAQFQTNFLNRIAGPQSTGSAQRSLDVRAQDPTFRFNKMLGEAEAFKVKIEKELEPLRNLMEKVVSKWTTDVGKHLGGIVKTVKETFSSFASGLKIEFPDISKSFGEVKTQLRSIGEALGIVSEKGGPTARQFKELGKEAGSLASGILKGLAGQFHLIHDSLKLIGDTIGPTITSLTGLGKNSKETGSAIESIGKIIGFIIPLFIAAKVAMEAWKVVQLALTVATAANSVALGVAKAAVFAYQAGVVIANAATKAWTIAQIALGVATEIALGPIGAIILVLTGVAFAFTYLYTHSKPFHDFINSIPQLIQHGLGAALEWLKSNWKEALFVLLTGPIGLTYEFLKHFGPTILSHISTAVSGVLDWLKANWKEALLLAVMGPFGLILAAFKLLPGSWKDKAGAAIGGFISGIKDKAGDLANAVKNALVGAIEKAVGVIKGSMPDWVKKILGIDLNAGGKDKSDVNGTGLLATTSGGGLGPGLGRATLGKNAPFVDSGSELGNYAMFQANRIKYSGALLDYDYGTAPHKVSLPRGNYTYGGQYSLKGMGTFEWFNTQNGGVIGFNHLQSTPNYKVGQHLSGGAKVGISGEPTDPRFGSGYHLCIVTDAKGREYFQWLSTEQMNNVVKAGGGISSQVAGYSSMIQKASKQTGAPVDLLAAIMQTESGGYSTKISPAGALGLMQIMPDNLKHLGVTNWKDAQQNITGGAKLLMEYYRQSGGDWNQALKWYNAGYAHPEKGAGYAKTVLALAHNVGFHGGAGTDPTSFGGKYNAPPPGGWAYGVVGATFEGQMPFDPAHMNYGPFPVSKAARTAFRDEPAVAEAYSHYMDQITAMPKDMQGYLRPEAKRLQGLLVGEDQNYQKVRSAAVGQYTKEYNKVKQRFENRKTDLLSDAQQRDVYKIAGTDITTDARKRKELQQVVSARAAYNTRIANLNTEEQAALRGDFTTSQRKADTDKYKRLRTQATTAFNRKTAGYETDLFGQDQVSKDRLNLYLKNANLTTSKRSGRISRDEQIALNAVTDKYFGTTGVQGKYNVSRIDAAHKDTIKQIISEMKVDADPSVIIATETKKIADKLKKGMDGLVYNLLTGGDQIGKYTKMAANAVVAQSRLTNLNARASMVVEERLAKDKDYTKTLAETQRIEGRTNLAKQKEADNALELNLRHDSYIKTLGAAAMEGQRNTLLQAKQNLAVAEMTTSSDKFTKSLYQTQIANQASAQLQAAQNLTVSQMLAGNTAYTQSLIEMRTIDEANAQLQSGVALRVSTAFTDLAGMAQSVGEILNANIGKWTDSVGKGAGYLNTYTSGLKAAYDEQVALTDADNKRNVILGQVLGDFQRLSSGLQGIFSTSMEKISLWTAMLGRSGDGITTATGDIVKLGVQALKDAGNLASLDGVIAGIGSVVSGLKSAAGTEFMRTGSISGGTISAYGAAQTSLTQANWDDVAKDLILGRSNKDLPGYMDALGREIQMMQNKTEKDAATFGQHSTQVQQDMDQLKALQKEYDGLGIAIKRLTDTTLKAPEAPDLPTSPDDLKKYQDDFKKYQDDLKAWDEDTVTADAAMAAFASGGVTAAETALQGMTAVINTSATDLSGSLANASSGAKSLADTTVNLTSAFTSLTSAVGALLSAIGVKGGGGLGGGGLGGNAAPGQRQGQGTNGGHTFSVYRDPDTGQTSYVWDTGVVTDTPVFPANMDTRGATTRSTTPPSPLIGRMPLGGLPSADTAEPSYQAGYSAGKGGVGSNPYPEGSYEWNQWQMGMMNAVVAKGNSPTTPPPALVTPPAVIPGAVPSGAPIGGASIGFTQPTAQQESLYTPVPGMPGLFYMHADPKNPDQGVYVYTSSNGTQTFYTGDKYKPGTTPKITGKYDISANLGSTDGSGSVGSGATPSAFMSASSDIMGNDWTRQYYGGNTFDPYGNSLDPKVQGGGFGSGGGSVEFTPTSTPSIGGITTTFKPDPYGGNYGAYRYNPNGATFESSATFDNQAPGYGSPGGIRPASMGGAGFYAGLMNSSIMGILGSTPGGSEIADALRTIAQSSQQTASNTGDIASNISNMDPAEVAKQLRSLLTQVREYEATHGRSIPGLATMGWDEFSRNAGAIATQAGI